MGLSASQGEDKSARQVRPGWRLVLFLTVFFDLLGFGIVIPFLPMYAERLGVGPAAIGLLLSSYSLAQLFCAPWLGRLSDRWGRRPIILLGLLGSSVSYVVYGLSRSFVGLWLSRGLHGACAATVSVAQAYAADVTGEEERASAMGMLGAAFGLGFVFGPALGGLLGWSSLSRPVFFAALLTFANFLFAWLRLVEPPGARARVSAGGMEARQGPLGALRRLLALGASGRLLCVSFLLAFTIAGLETTFSLLLPQCYALGARSVGALLAYAAAIQAVAQGFLVGRLVRLVGPRPLLSAAILVFGLGLAPLGSWLERPGLFLMLALVGCGYGLASTSLVTLLCGLTDRERQGELLGLNQSMLSLGRILGPLFGGFVYQAVAPAAPYLAGAAVAGAAFTLTWPRTPAGRARVGAAKACGSDRPAPPTEATGPAPQ